ncbi:MAG TPA: YbaK/EbsC family protein [Candidatus Limnocylindrales bacterium]|nr:YbaK/EbsC family protein [Candidatus Limnocylindrales bacterium]
MPEPTDHPAIQRVRDAAARKGVTLDIHVFEVSTHTAEEAAATVGAELGQIVKSLVFVSPGADGVLEPVVCLVSGPNRVDLARLAAVTGNLDVRRSTAREAQELTGFVIGGIPPFGHNRPVRAIMDPDLTRYQVVWAAAGLPTAVFPVPPGTLRILANATVAPIVEERPLEAGVGVMAVGVAGAPAAALEPLRADGSAATATADVLVPSGGPTSSNAGA